MTQKFIKCSLLIGTLCLGVFLGAMLFGKEEAIAQKQSVFAFATTGLIGNEMTEQQQDVWDFVQESWQSYVDEKELDEQFEFFHEDFSFWWSKDAIPNNASDLRKWTAYHMESSDLLLFNLRPVSIHVKDNFACVYYYTEEVRKSNDGKTNEQTSQLGEIYFKEDGEWKILWGHGGPFEVE